MTAASSVTPAAARTSGTVTGAPRRWLRLEAAVLLAGSLIAFSATGQPWWLVPLTILVPDVSAAGYLGGIRLGAQPVTTSRTAIPARRARGSRQGRAGRWSWPSAWSGSRISARTGAGYGLKYGDNFQHTHLGQLGRPGDTP